MDKTIAQISLALDAALMRHTAIAANIANVHTMGYQPMTVTFETLLADDWVKPVYIEDHSQPSIDTQLADSVKNATHYRALVKGLNHKLAIMALALQGSHV